MENNNNPKCEPLECEEICDKDKDCMITCEKTVHQKTKVALPISVEPFVIPGKVKARCCGTPKITSECKDHCSYVVTQEICIEIPLKFGVCTEIKKSFVECEEPYIEESCKD